MLAGASMLALVLGLLLDRWLGEPDWLWRRFRHPVVLFGAIIDRFDGWRRADDASGPNRFRDRRFGLGLLIVFAALALVAGLIEQAVWSPLGIVFEVMIVAVLVAQKSLIDHVSSVKQALRRSLEEGREALSMIVGRDVSRLDASDVRRAALESLAENASDGIVAPVFWFVIAGVPGILFYKAVNTADSMIGHRNERFEHFGKPAAILDDWLNWVPARLTALAVVLLSSPVKRLSTIWHSISADARRHRSPNAGWPETAFAIALGIRFGGPRRYGDEMVEGVVLNGDGAANVQAAEVQQGLALFSGLCWLLLGVAVVLFALFG